MVVVFTTYSCSNAEYNDYDTERESIVGFAEALAIAIVPVEDNSIDIEIEFITSDVASTDRTYQVYVVSEGTNIDAENFSFNPSVVMPANQYYATFTFTAIDVSLPTSFGDVFLAFETNGDILTSREINLKVKKDD